VFNTAFFIDTGSVSFEPYFKIRLLPFSEVMPFEAQLPILNRLNLGEADFTRGTEEKMFRIGGDMRAAPFICFEILFPDFVRRRVRKGANLLVNITNDGWWGKSNGPFHHAAMARMRCVENGISMARCANSGISMLCDQYGRVRGRTGLYERTVLTGSLPLEVVPTLYTRFGDWPLFAALLVVVEAVLYALYNFLLARRRARMEKGKLRNSAASALEK
jgi:apolipoprotein N-acyltransferase